jgi:hypothetical protein
MQVKENTIPLNHVAARPPTSKKHYPATGISIGITAVEEQRQGQVPLLKLYDSFDPVIVRASTSSDPIAANYTAALAVLDSNAGKVAGSATASFLGPDKIRGSRPGST